MHFPLRNLLLAILPVLSVLFFFISPVWLSRISNSNYKTVKTITEDAIAKRAQNTYGNDWNFENNQISLQAANYRAINDFKLSKLLLASDIEGALHALDRETGEIIWSLDVEEPLVKITTNQSKEDQNIDEDALSWMVEPYGDGNLYFFNKEFGLNKLPVSISHLVLQSPFALSNDEKIYTGIRKSALYSLNVNTGEIVSSYGSGCDAFGNDKVCKDTDDTTESCPEIVLVGKTTYELTIYSKENVHWNVTYSTWGQNNIDMDLAYQNTVPLDQTYIAPFHDNTLLAIDVESKIAKWVSQLPQTIVNVFDILQDERLANSGINDNYLIVPHPLKAPLGFEEEENLGVYLDTTKNGSWYAMSGEYYPSLVKSAPASRYSLSERWRVPSVLNIPDLFITAITGVHSTTNGAMNYNKPNPSKASLGYPTNFPQQYPPHRPPYTPGSNEIDTYNPPSRSQWLGLPSASEAMLEIGPSPEAQGNHFNNWALVFSLISVFFLGVFYKRFNWFSSLNALLKKNGLELKEVTYEEQSKILVNHDIDENNKESIDNKKDSKEELPTSANGANSNKSKEKAKKEVKIVVPTQDGEKANGESNVVKKRKRGSRGGKKNKKSNDLENKDTVEAADTTISKPESSNAPQKLNELTISDTVLGYGSYGTMVYKGTFQNRDVAVKRMLIEFYDVASHEINLLTESDDHSNVIRYFYSETNDKFLYIALELCSASLEDIIEKPTNYLDLTKLMNPVDVLFQIAQGLHHLHSLKIVHRDIKPQNILVAPPKKIKSRSSKDEYAPVRILISDFGLCKRLETDESSFRATTQHAAGTSGWRAPELLVDATNTIYNSCSVSSDHSFTTSSNSIAEPLVFDTLSKRRLTRAIDIFSLGCVFFYILSHGNHPFGDRYLREGNVIKGEYSLEALEILPDNLEEAKDLISKMISRNPKLRLNTSQVLNHPYFWDDSKKLDFLLKVSDRFEVERRDPPSALLLELESVATKVIADDWCRKFDKNFLDNLGKYRKYHPDRLMDLLRALRNKYHHFNDLPPELATRMSPLPNGFYQFFNKRFPNLLMEIYHVVEEHLNDDPILETFLKGY
ncbi:Serine/threonine-protein kinase [Wickerhamomyces ciferrii]|uniref:non-specific serine/threonine protein kinase n=1 Tax=Wickerhamomyces ciferrii (strain ATCC 14091 / BCRC 22168 / CBS 111 / JCM 3599 / NBRC 0793 / NRRL Y-1031 F-60-10) TaxID=1206466 RepID=K0K9N9_WICCF|nr:Serine/threonine-protein kinase [Wickerhamomyces ciferrii]CCH41635.1 Serine/threonine-protein kinase [Wickerhamomyces ciferrii]